MATLLPFPGALAATSKSPEELSLPELEQRLAGIDFELDQLARFSLRSGVGSIGYRSASHKEEGASEWLQVAVDPSAPIDDIVLIPTLWRDSSAGFQSDGFPSEFRILAGTKAEPEGKVIAEFGKSDKLLPRIAPVTIPVNGVRASWIRVEATKLTRRAFDKSYIFQLAELMVFSGNSNIALKSQINASSVHSQDLVHAWDINFVVDGHTPFLMDAAQGESSLAYISSINKNPDLGIDLGKDYPLSEIHLHAVDQSDTVPQAYPGNLGMPVNLVIEGASKPDFSDAQKLLSVHSESFTDTGPIMMWPLPPEKPCRYVRLSARDGDLRSRFGFAEIELFSNYENVALHKPTFPKVPGASPESTGRSPAALTDGRNLYGEIIPIRTWMNQLAQRHDLETERPQVSSELNLRYTHQKRNLWIMTWVGAILAAAVGFFILFERMLRMRQATRIRERLAADLHDELGANIHTIGLLGDLARESTSREERNELLERTRTYTERSGIALRNCTNMLEAEELCEDLVEEMKRCSKTLLADLEHTQDFRGTENIENLKPKKRIGVFFFYKECLTNILRHSAATKATTKLEADKKWLTLTITDNGLGLGEETPNSLKRRARLLRATLKVENSNGSGTSVTLRLKLV